jgi:hypothetical protein
VDVPSAPEAWVAAACTPAVPDFSAWLRRQVGGVTIATVPGYVVEQGPSYNILLRTPGRTSSIVFQLERDPRQFFDVFYYRQQQKRNVCRASIAGYPADVVAWYDRGKYGLVARWEATWGGEDAGKWLLAFITSTRAEEAIELRAVLHTIRPVTPNQREPEQLHEP